MKEDILMFHETLQP